MNLDIIDVPFNDITNQNGDIIDELFGDKALRWYQVAARNQTIQALNEGSKRILIVLPTGAGKTITVACTLGSPEMMKALGVSGRRLRVLFVAHKHRLLSQAEETFAAENNVELILQSMFSNIPDEIVERGWDVCVLDEAHHESCASFQYQLEHIGDFPVIGLTATSDRADGCLIKFDVIVNPISREQAVAEGYLAETNLHTFVDVPSSSKTPILTDIFNNFASEMGQTMVFVKTKREVMELTNVLLMKGYKAVALLNQSEAQLNQILDDFSEGKIQFILNCFKIGEGVDVKGCSDVVVGRQVGSYPYLNQLIGRAARPDCDCNVWELVNPLSGKNLDTTVVTGTPKSHRLLYKQCGVWEEEMFDYTSAGHNSDYDAGVGVERYSY